MPDIIPLIVPVRRDCEADRTATSALALETGQPEIRPSPAAAAREPDDPSPPIANDPPRSSAQNWRPPSTGPPSRHYLDRRAAGIAEAGGGGNPDDLLTTAALAEWLQTSVAWLEIGRCKRYGPVFIRLSPRRIRYRRSDVLDWLAERSHRATDAYDSERMGRKRGSRVVDGHVVRPE
jgi:hypothetical protein